LEFFGLFIFKILPSSALSLYNSGISLLIVVIYVVDDDESIKNKLNKKTDLTDFKT